MIGIDEVGRGCWAGPLVVCGVKLADGDFVGLKDSKATAKKKRQALMHEIKAKALDIELVWVSPQYIDHHGLTKSMQVACEQIFSRLSNGGEPIIIDGSINFLPGKAGVETMIKGDEKVPAIAAASILAKVTRDTFMEQVSHKYPGYGFESHVGYGTKQHMDALAELGLCKLHRKSYKPLQKYAQ